ncbi:hypothetical protein IAU60_001585 [Kwoniella sp. DSM 27419]
MSISSNAVAGPSNYAMGMTSDCLYEDQAYCERPGGDGSTPKRGKTGCITCRLRKKRCDEAKPVCATCTRLGIECMGYGAKRPKWLKEKDNAKKAKQNIKQIVSSRRGSRKGYDMLEGADVKVDYSRSGSRDSSQSAHADGTQDGPGGVAAVATQGVTMGVIPGASDIWQAGGGGAPAVGGWEPDETTKGFEQPVYQEIMTDDPNIIELSSYTQVDPMAAQPVYPSVATDPTIYPAGVGSAFSLMDGTTTLMPSTDLGAVTPSIPLQASNGTNTVNPDASGMDAIWSMFMGGQVASSRPRSSNSSPISPFLTIPSPSTGLSPPAPANMQYLHYFITVVLPIQYRVTAASNSMANMIAPLALSRNEVSHSVSALAALHKFAKRTKKRAVPLSPRFTAFSPATGKLDCDIDGDADAQVATTSHQKTMDRLRFISPQDLTAEEIIVAVLFAISYHLFSGGTSKHLNELVATLRRCLSAALLTSPELFPGEQGKISLSTGPSPWARYRQLIEHMIWTDIIAAVTQNKATQLLATYRRLLDHMPADPASGTEPLLLMDRLLALCEVVALSEWKERAEDAGCMSIRELLNRSTVVEKLLNERAWRESHLDQPNITDIGTDAYHARDMRRIMSDVFYGSVKVLLGVVINGPFPRVPEIASAVQDTMEALHRLDIQYPNPQIRRALVLPITVAGCHCETPMQQAYFRQCFDQLGSEAKAFGNTGPALDLMIEVWRQRAEGGPGARVDWRKVMVDLGWEEGVMLI